MYAKILLISLLDQPWVPSNSKVAEPTTEHLGDIHGEWPCQFVALLYNLLDFPSQQQVELLVARLISGSSAEQ